MEKQGQIKNPKCPKWPRDKIRFQLSSPWKFSLLKHDFFCGVWLFLFAWQMCTEDFICSCKPESTVTWPDTAGKWVQNFFCDEMERRELNKRCEFWCFRNAMSAACDLTDSVCIKGIYSHGLICHGLWEPGLKVFEDWMLTQIKSKLPVLRQVTVS